MLCFDPLPERSSERQQAALVHVEAALLVAADDVKGERQAVPGRVSVRHHELEDAAADRLALLQETRETFRKPLDSKLASNHGPVYDGLPVSTHNVRKVIEPRSAGMRHRRNQFRMFM